MGTLDEAHLSVGSAMNDATRLVGGALGVAVLGSLMTSHYGDAHAVGARSRAGLGRRRARGGGPPARRRRRMR